MSTKTTHQSVNLASMGLSLGEKMSSIEIPAMHSHYVGAIDFLHAHRYWVAVLFIVGLTGISAGSQFVTKSLKVGLQRNELCLRSS